MDERETHSQRRYQAPGVWLISVKVCARYGRSKRGQEQGPAAGLGGFEQDEGHLSVAAALRLGQNLENDQRSGLANSASGRGGAQTHSLCAGGEAAAVVSLLASLEEFWRRTAKAPRSGSKPASAMRMPKYALRRVCLAGLVPRGDGSSGIGRPIPAHGIEVNRADRTDQRISPSLRWL